jgi:hypothetical protein
MASPSVRELRDLWRARAEKAFHRGYITPSRLTRRGRGLPAQPNVSRKVLRRSRRSRRAPYRFPGMLNHPQFDRETALIKAQIKMAETKRITALVAQQRAIKMENGNAKNAAKKAANNAVDNAQRQIDLLTAEMYKLLHL